MVLDQKTNFFPGKGWFSVEKPTFSSEKDGFGAKKLTFSLGRTKKTIFLEFGRIISQKMFFVFLRKKLVVDWKSTVLPLSACSRRTRTRCLAVGF